MTYVLGRWYPYTVLILQWIDKDLEFWEEPEFHQFSFIMEDQQVWKSLVNGHPSTARELGYLNLK